MLAHRYDLILFYPITQYLQKLIQKYKTVSFNPNIIISPFNPSENKNSPEKYPYDSLENSDEETTPDTNLIDNERTPFDANLSPPLSFENSQQIPREPNNQINKPQLDEIIPSTPQPEP